MGNPSEEAPVFDNEKTLDISKTPSSIIEPFKVTENNETTAPIGGSELNDRDILATYGGTVKGDTKLQIEEPKKSFGTEENDNRSKTEIEIFSTPEVINEKSEILSVVFNDQ